MKAEKKINILLVEDDINLSFLLSENLKSKGFNVHLATTGNDAVKMISLNTYDLCILDVMLPEVDGFTIAALLKQRQQLTPFIFLTARTQEGDKLQGFEAGADDYITKPFSFKELYYRILVILRRFKAVPQANEKEIYQLGPLSLDATLRELTVNNNTRKLSQREAGLLSILLSEKGAYVQRSEMLKKVWGNDDYFTAKSMDVYITRLRKLLKDVPELEIENLYGMGYRIRYVPKI